MLTREIGMVTVSETVMVLGVVLVKGDDDNEGTGVGDDVDEGDRDGERDID